MKFKKLFLSLAFALIFISPSAFAETKCAKVSIIGNYWSGKTAIFKRIIGEQYMEEDAGDTTDYRQKDICEIVNGNVLSIKIWDTPGLKEYRKEVITKLANSNLIYFVVDMVKKYDGDMEQYFRDIINAIRTRCPNCKIVFLFTKYDKKDEEFPIAMENSGVKRNIEGMHEQCYFTSSKEDFICNENDFIHARDLKQNMINYLTQHINELPDHHEDIRIRSDWEVEQELAEKDRIHQEYINSNSGGGICSLQ